MAIENEFEKQVEQLVTAQGLAQLWDDILNAVDGGETDKAADID